MMFLETVKAIEDYCPSNNKKILRMYHYFCIGQSVVRLLENKNAKQILLPSIILLQKLLYIQNISKFCRL